MQALTTSSTSAWLGKAWEGRQWSGLLIGFLPLVYFLSRFRGKGTKKSTSFNPNVTDPALFKKYSWVDSYHVEATGLTYPRVRTVFRPHPQADKLPAKPTPLPLLVYIHGLGGCGAQFASLLTSLSNVGPCLVIDLPGCGLSSFLPRDWQAYSTQALVELLAVIIERRRDAENGQGVVLIAHSMGCSLSALLAGSDSSMSKHVMGVIAMCLRASPMNEKQEKATRRMLRIPEPVFDSLRRWDRRRGLESHSVYRMAGKGADPETKKLQLRYNTQSRTPVWRRMTHGLLPTNSDTSGLPKIETWKTLNCPLFLIAGESDGICPPVELHTIGHALRETWCNQKQPSQPEISAPSTSPAEAALLARPQRRTLKTVILPAPASHALPYSPGTVRTLSGLIQSFLATQVDPRLSLGWQLTYLSDSGKWEVKNLVKWQKTAATSREPVGRHPDASGKLNGGVFLAMKTMREVDDVHNPKKFVKEWGGKVKAVVDISHESPVYDPNGLEEGGIHYYKFPSVSKLPPTDDEVHGFEDLIDRLRGVTSGGGDVKDSDQVALSNQEDKLIAVHCHYGFNRTGFFIICYLVDRMGWKLQDAIDDFARVRPPGVKHSYFVDALFVRYSGTAEDSE